MRWWATLFVGCVLAAAALGSGLGCQQAQMKQRGQTAGSVPTTEAQKKKGWFDDWGKPKPAAEAQETAAPAHSAHAAQDPGRKPSDPTPIPLYAVQLEVFQLDVPHGSVSGNAEFWKRVNEFTVDVASHQVLNANGFRVGQAPVSDWDYFREILDRGPVRTQHNMYVAYQAKHVELLVRREAAPRNLFVFVAGEPAIGRSYGESDYTMQLSFWPTPRRNGEVHVKLVPVVRSRMRKLERYWDGEQEAMRIVKPEKLYDLKLEADVTPGSFLVVAPSADARASTSLGNAFMLDDSGPDRTETVLIFVTRLVGEGPLATTTRPAAGG